MIRVWCGKMADTFVFIGFGIALIILSISTAIRFDKIDKNPDVEELKQLYNIFSALLAKKFPQDSEIKKTDELLSKIPLHQYILEKYLKNEDKLDELLNLIKEKPPYFEMNDYGIKAFWKSEDWDKIVIIVKQLRDKIKPLLKET